MRKSQFKETKTWISNSYLTRPDKAFNGTVVNRALQSLYRGPFEVTLTVPLTKIFRNYTSMYCAGLCMLKY